MNQIIFKMAYRIARLLFLLGIFFWGISFSTPAPVWAVRLTPEEKTSLVQSASVSMMEAVEKIQQHYKGKAKFAHISRHKDQLVYQVGIVVDEQLKIVILDPDSGKIIQEKTAEKFWERFFTSEEQAQFLKTPTDLLKAVRLVLEQQKGLVIGSYFKLEDGVHFYRVVLWADQRKQIWIVDSDTEVAFLAKKNHQ
ncbi:MAG: PepSY domain-containing protein [SAR324 cluster bacterium]|nr:PepSY domain-containing protein [SAR324 cluster bacterium]